MKTIYNNPKFYDQWEKIQSDLNLILEYCHKPTKKLTYYDIAEARSRIQLTKLHIDQLSILMFSEIKVDIS